MITKEFMTATRAIRATRSVAPRLAIQEKPSGGGKIIGSF
jgi:hypothetical protein